MPPKKINPVKSKGVFLKGKGITKGNKRKKKRKHESKPSFPYTLLPKQKQLATKTVTKLDKDNANFMITRGVDAIITLEYDKYKPGGYYTVATSQEEQKWRLVQKQGVEYQKWKETKMANIQNRAVARRKRVEEKQRQELRRKYYRVHPDDVSHMYIEGYTKSRHRISKKRFMKCVDVPLFQEVLNENTEILESPLWAEKLNLKSFSAEKVKQMKNHLHQFDVLVDSLKQGLFDTPNCDRFPINVVRRKKKKDGDVEDVQHKVKVRSRSVSGDNNLRRRLSFPPYELAEDEVEEDISKLQIFQGALSSIARWIGGSKPPPVTPSKTKPKLPAAAQPSEGDQNSTVISAVENTAPTEMKDENTLPPPEVSHSFKWARKTSLKVFPPLLRHHSINIINDEYDIDDVTEDTDKHGPFGDLLTINIPNEPTQRKKFIRSLIERKTKKRGKKNVTKMTKNAKSRHEEDEIRQRHERYEKSDPMQRLHQDEKDSDIWTVPSTTTTNGYASWRRPRDLRNAGNKQAILAHKVDTTFGWRVILLLIVIWEIGCFVKAKLDDIYYWIFTSHLYKENIWLFEPTLISETDRYIFLHIQEWVHLVVSGISVSIIHRENECVSLLFALSLLIDGGAEVGISTHDYIYLPDPISWTCVILTAFHIVWKVFIVCLFIGYHFYCSGYIRKTREFRHRKTRLHNHEINAKGTKGIQKRRMAWSWMASHARNTNLRKLKRKYPTVRDCNFPIDELDKEIKFSETKELRLYTQKHDLNIGYPYNKLRDMRRYVFKKLEKSDYTDEDDAENKQEFKRKLSKMIGRSSRAITVTKWKQWKTGQKNKERIAKFQEELMTEPTKYTLSKSHIRSKKSNLTIAPSFSISKLTKTNL